MTKNMTDPEYGHYGVREDGRNLVQDWVDVHLDMGYSDDEVIYATNMAEFNATDASNVQFFMGKNKTSWLIQHPWLREYIS